MAHKERVGTSNWSSTLLATGGKDKSILIQDIRCGSTGGAQSVVNELVAHKQVCVYDSLLSISAPVVKKSIIAKHPYEFMPSLLQEICGLKWSFDERQLASGGNDNKLYVWDISSDPTAPVFRFSDHSAAVKAVAWSPHQHGLLASGGGTADRHIRFWNTITGAPLQKVDTGSQVRESLSLSLSLSLSPLSLMHTHTNSLFFLSNFLSFCLSF